MTTVYQMDTTVVRLRVTGRGTSPPIPITR